MAQDKVSQRYAKAIFDYLKDSQKTRNLISELLEFDSVLKASHELSLVLTSDVYSEKERNEIVADLVTKIQLSEDARKTLLVLS
ncbi:MAG: F0F1 ATP synthase subunit delta, partial [Deltaproteobacteria bacterium]